LILHRVGTLEFLPPFGLARSPDKFNSKVLSKSLGPFGMVKYYKFRQGVDPSLAPVNLEKWFKQQLNSFFIKSRDWLYEEEYRRVFQLKKLIHAQPDEERKRHFLLKIDGTDIREVIFGCRIDEVYENRIRAQLGRRPKIFGHVKLFRCKRHHSRFKLEIVPL
jgi:hypothetical protein